MAESNKIIKDYKAPPTLEKNSLYVNWKKEVQIWEAFTSLPEEKRAPAIFMTLRGEAKEAILNMDIALLTAANGVKNLTDELDKMYLKDESSQAYEAYEIFEKFMRPSGMSISDYVIKFEQLYFKAKSFKMEILDGVLAYRLLNSANLSNEQKQLVKATVSKMDYQIMKDQLKKVFTNTSENFLVTKDSFKPEVKSEESDVFYASGNYNNMPNNCNRGCGRNNYFRKKAFNRDYNSNKNYQNQGNNKKTNPLNAKGEVSRCNFCGSKFHWANNCPDALENFQKDI